MPQPLALPALVALAVCLGAAPAAACTAFLLERGGKTAVGKEYDWSMGQALVMTNPVGLAKQALPMMPGDKPARWVSKHASLTFNQYGRELPNGGINDAGLVVEVLWWDGSVFARPDARPSLSELQFVQYLLDNFSTLADATAHAGEVRVSRVYGAVHYFVCDKSGACAAFELVGGKLSVSPARALANDGYAESARYLAKHAGFGGKAPAPAGGGSLARFVRANTRAAAPAANVELSSAALEILDSVQIDSMKWHIVYVPSELRVYFRTRAQPTLKWIELGKLDASCSAAARLLDIDSKLEGDVTAKLAEYTEAANERLVAASLGPLKGKLPPGAIEAVARYPSKLPCTVPGTAIAP